MGEILSISKIKRIPFREDINGLRAIAVLAVVLYHADFELFKGGWLGVDIFFVISGYLISNIIISELNQKTFSFKNFYKRRIKRILPALLSMLLLTIPFSYWLLLPKQIIEYSNSLVSSVFFYANYYFQNLDFYNSAQTKFMPLLHTWSLAIEEQYYLVFPLMAFVVYKFLKKYFTIFILLIFFLSIYINTITSNVNKFYQIQFRIWELLLGVLVMILSFNLKIKHLEKIGFLLMIFPVFYYGDDFINDIEPKIFALTGVSLIIFSNSQITILTKLLKSKFFTTIGLCSYSIYLLHQPLFSFVENYLKGRLIQNNFWIKILLILIVLIFGYFFFQVFERKVANSRYLNIYILLIIILISSFSFQTIQTDGYPERFEDTNIYLKKYLVDAQRDGVDLNECNTITFPNLDFFCNISFDPSKSNLVIIGDSHLKTLSKNIFDNHKSSYNLFISIQKGCPFILSLDTNTRAICAHPNQSAEYEFITKTSNTITIFGGRFPWYFNGSSFESNLGKVGDEIKAGGQELLDDLEKNVIYLKENSDELIIIEPIPELGFYPLEPYIYKFYNLDESIQYEYSYWKSYSYEVNLLLRKLNKSNIATDKIFCDSFIKGQCVVSYSRIMFYYDDDHLTYDGSKLIEEILSKQYLNKNN